MKFDDLLTGNMVNNEIARRTGNARQLAQRYTELRGLPYEVFLDRLFALGVEVDFITSSEMHTALNEEKHP